MKGAALLSIVAFACFTELAYGQNVPTNLRVLNPGITAQSQNQTVIAGQSATFTVAVTGNVPLSYQWTFNGSNVGSSSSAYTRANCQLTDNGGRVQVAVSNSSGSVESSTATLTVNPTGTTYYVATSGSSSNTGLSTNSPWPLTYAVTKLGPGVTLTLMPGAYSGPIIIYNVNGTAQNPMTIRSQVKWKAVIANSTNHGIALGFTPFVNYLVMDGLCVSNSARDGIGLAGQNCTVRNCWVTGSHHLGINVSNPNCSNNIIENNLIELSGGGVWDGVVGHRWHGIYISGPNNIIRNNVVRHNAGYGIHLYTGYSMTWQNNNLIYNNLTYGHTNFYGVTIWGAVDGGALPGTNCLFGNTILDGVSLSYGAVCITNNIILPSVIFPSSAITYSEIHPPTVYADYNLSTYAITPTGAHDVVVSTVGFVNPGNGLCWLTANSSARGAANRNVVPPVDFFGNSQSSVTDIGAFQYKATLAGDIRVLDPSPANPDYWSLP
jgi:hypothetical protein